MPSMIFKFVSYCLFTNPIFSALDPNNKAIKYFFSDKTQKTSDTEGERLYNERRNCYANIIKVFDTLKSSDEMLTEESQRREELAAEVKSMVCYDLVLFIIKL